MGIILFLLSSYPQVITVDIPEEAPHYVVSMNTVGVGVGRGVLIYTNPLLNILTFNISTKLIPFNGLALSAGYMLPYPEYILNRFMDENVTVDFEGDVKWFGLSIGVDRLSINYRFVLLKDGSINIVDAGGVVPLLDNLNLLYQTGLSFPLQLKYGVGFEYWITDHIFIKLGVKEGVKDMGYRLLFIPYLDFGFVKERR